jgi:hypothetical protein
MIPPEFQIPVLTGRQLRATLDAIEAWARLLEDDPNVPADRRRRIAAMAGELAAQREVLRAAGWGAHPPVQRWCARFLGRHADAILQQVLRNERRKAAGEPAAPMPRIPELLFDAICGGPGMRQRPQAQRILIEILRIVVPQRIAEEAVGCADQRAANQTEGGTDVL